MMDREKRIIILDLGCKHEWSLAELAKDGRVRVGGNHPDRSETQREACVIHHSHYGQGPSLPASTAAEPPSLLPCSAARA